PRSAVISLLCWPRFIGLTTIEVRIFMTYVTENHATERLNACPLCGGSDLQPLHVPGRWIGSEFFGDLHGRLGIVRCRGCGLVFTSPRPSEERLSAFYSGDTYSCHEEAGSASAGVKAIFLLDR